MKFKSKLESIISGWRNDARARRRRLPAPLIAWFTERLEECRSNQCRRLLAGVCTGCGCPVSKKTKSVTEECPDNRWLPRIYTAADGTELVLLAELPAEIAALFTTTRPAYQYLEEYQGGIRYADWFSFLEELESLLE